MLFGNHKTKTQVQLLIHKISIERVYEIQFLAVILIHKIVWKSQINHVKEKLAKTIATLGKSRYILDHNHYTSIILILPYLTYCVAIW